MPLCYTSKTSTSVHARTRFVRHSSRSVAAFRRSALVRHIFVLLLNAAHARPARYGLGRPLGFAHAVYDNPERAIQALKAARLRKPTVFGRPMHVQELKPLAPSPQLRVSAVPHGTKLTDVARVLHVPTDQVSICTSEAIIHVSVTCSLEVLTLSRRGSGGRPTLRICRQHAGSLTRYANCQPSRRTTDYLARSRAQRDIPPT
jgi:hypothetical protein